jgi:hypothetical protein
VRSWVPGALLVALALSGCTLSASLDTGAGRATRPSQVRALTPEQAADALAALPRTARDPSGPAYDRDAFGEAWADVDGNGCNQRDDVLLRDAVPGSTTTQRQGACDHDVLAGSWVDPYTGRTVVLDDLKDLAQAQAVQIDHVVPLAEAWRSGASAWTAREREAFANDLAVLAATDGPTNAAKSDDDPAAWLPRAPWQCDYALRWIAVKSAYALAADDSEVAALTGMLERCPTRRNDPVR